VKVQITLKSGAQITVDAARFEVDYDGPSDRIASVKWKHDRTGGNLLAGIVRSEVAAVVLLDAPAPTVTDADREQPEGAS